MSIKRPFISVQEPRKRVLKHINQPRSGHSRNILGRGISKTRAHTDMFE